MKIRQAFVKDEKGNMKLVPAVKEVEILVGVPKARIVIDGKVVNLQAKRQRLYYKAPPGKVYTGKDIDNILYAVADKLEKALPFVQFTLVKKIEPGRYTLVGEVSDGGKAVRHVDNGTGFGEVRCPLVSDTSDERKTDNPVVGGPSGGDQTAVVP